MLSDASRQRPRRASKAKRMSRFTFLLLVGVFGMAVKLNFKQLAEAGDMNEQATPFTDVKEKISLEMKTKATIRPLKVQSDENTCDRLFGFRHIEEDGHCLVHDWMGWKACKLSTSLFVNTAEMLGPPGNEKINSVLGREENAEFIQFRPGSFVVSDKASVPTSMDSSWQKVWSSFIEKPLDSVNVDETPTIFLFRPTYANPCFWMASMYSLFVALTKWNLLETHVRLVFMDGHAHGQLDDEWANVFLIDQVLHVKQLPAGVTYTQAYFLNTESAFHDPGLRRHRVGDACRSDSSLHQFRDFVLTNLGLSLKQADTKELTLLIRSDYMAHPRSNGVLDRKIDDIPVAKKQLQAKYSDHQVVVYSFEALSFHDQVAIVSQTDLLAAIHGAGNIHVLFLPQHAQLVEYFPPGFMGRVRFQYLAACMGIHYSQKQATKVKSLAGGKFTVQPIV